MAKSRLNEVVQRVQRTLLQEEAGLTDGQLLRCFVEQGDERAFTAIVRRHGALVLGVCRRMLPHHDAEDAFQATFLVLARKAASIAVPERLTNWLHGVAYNAARKAKAMMARRQRKERQAAILPDAAAHEQDLWNDLRPILDHEIRQLPEKYRLPLLLCDLEGKPRKEVARQLDWSEGTLSGRLARARTMLARRLTRRGVVVSGGFLAALLSEHAASAQAPAGLISATLKAAAWFTAGQTTAISATVVALTQGVLKSMLLTKLRIAIGVLLGIGLIAFGGGLVTSQTAPAPSTTAARADTTPQAIPAAPVETKSRQYQVECTLTSAGPDGKGGKGKVLAEPVLCMMEGVEASFNCGGHVPAPGDVDSPAVAWDLRLFLTEMASRGDFLSFGISVRLKVVGRADGRLRLQTVLEMTDVDRDVETAAQVGGRIVRSIANTKVGEPVRLAIKDDEGRARHWLQVKVVKEEIVRTQSRPKASSTARQGARVTDVSRADDPPAPELVRLRDQVKRLEERLAALEASSRKADVEAPAPARVGQIIVVGNARTPTSVILKQIPLYPGQVLDYPALRLAEKNLTRWNATVTVVEDKGSAYKDILVTVKEK